MAINFNIGDIVVVQQDYVNQTLANKETQLQGIGRSENFKAALTLLAVLDYTQLTVVNKGEVETYMDDKATKIVRDFMQVAPQNPQSQLYNNGQGVIIYWEKEDEVFSQIFKVSNSYIEDSRLNKVLNLSGKTLNQGQLVKVTGYIKSITTLTVDIDDVGVTKNSVVFGILTQNIKDKDMGLVRWYRPKPFNPQTV